MLKQNILLGDDFQSNAWNMQQVPPPPIINMQSEPQQPPPPTISIPPKPDTSDEDKKRYEGMKTLKNSL